MAKIEKKYSNLTIKDARPDDFPFDQAIKVDANGYDKVLKALSSIQESQTISSDVKVSNQAIKSSSSELSDIAQAHIGAIPGIPPVYMDCRMNYTSAYNSTYGYYFTSISDIHSWLDGSGLPLQYSWTQENSAYRYSNHQTKAVTTVSGVLDTYILVSGMPKISSQTLTFNYNWTARA